jgi:WD40 repeat protein
VSNHGRVLAHINIGSEFICVGVSRDGTRVVSGSSDGLVRIWDASTGAEVRKLKGHTSTVTSAAFSADGTRIVLGSGDNSVRIWDASTGAEVRMLKGHRSVVSSVGFSADGTRIVSGSGDNSVRIWDLEEVQHLDWEVGSKGWVVTKSSQQRLLWLPSQIHACLQKSYCAVMILQRKYCMINFSSEYVGPRWARCYRPVE